MWECIGLPLLFFRPDTLEYYLSLYDMYLGLGMPDPATKTKPKKVWMLHPSPQIKRNPHCHFPDFALLRSNTCIGCGVLLLLQRSKIHIYIYIYMLIICDFMLPPHQSSRGHTMACICLPLLQLLTLLFVKLFPLLPIPCCVGIYTLVSLLSPNGYYVGTMGQQALHTPKPVYIQDLVLVMRPPTTPNQQK